MICFVWQLAHNITIHIMRLSLQKGCFEFNVEKIPSFARCHLATHPKSRSGGSRRICLQVLLLFLLESSQYSSLLCPEEVALLVGRLVTEFFCLNLSKSKEVKKPHCQSRSSVRGFLQQIACSIFVLLGLMLLFAHEIAFWLQLLRLLQVHMERCSTFPV